MPVLILDPNMESKYRFLWETNDSNRHDEVWEGMLVVPPLPNNEHQQLVMDLTVSFYDIVQVPGLGQVYPGANVSDRASDWMSNYRAPDLVVYLNTNPAINHGTHWQGGPDVLVEIISPGEDPYAKFAFYASVNTREVLIVNRDPWSLELHQLQGGQFVVAGTSNLANNSVLTSSVLPLTFRLLSGQPRPRIEVVHPPTGRRWEA